MIDIVERLMICAKFDPDQKEAAELITRLRIENEKILDGMRVTIQERDILSGENYDLRAEIEKLRERLSEADEANRRVSDENETLRRDVKTAVMGDSAELQDVKRENKKLHREAAIRIDQIEREQEAHLKTMADLNKQAEMNGRLLTENAELRAENERLEDTRIEFIGMINKLIDERVKMRKALNPFAYYASQIPDDVSDTASASGTVGDLRAAAAALEDK